MLRGIRSRKRNTKCQEVRLVWALQDGQADIVTIYQMLGISRVKSDRLPE